MAFTALTRAQFHDLVDVFVGTATVDPSTIAAAAEGTTTVTVTGVALGDMVLGFGPGVDTGDLGLTVTVTAADTVSIFAINATGDHIDVASSTWNFLIGRPKGKITQQ